MILVGMGQDGGTNADVLKRLQERGGIATDMLGMHAAIEHYGILLQVEPVAI